METIFKLSNASVQELIGKQKKNQMMLLGGMLGGFLLALPIVFTGLYKSVDTLLLAVVCVGLVVVDAVIFVILKAVLSKQAIVEKMRYDASASMIELSLVSVSGARRVEQVPLGQCIWVKSVQSHPAVLRTPAGAFFLDVSAQNALAKAKLF